MNGQTNDTQAAKQADVPQATDLGNGREPQLVGSQKSQAILEKVKTFNWKLLGIITTLLGIAAGAISINQYLSEKPNLSINVEEMRFRPDNLSSMQKDGFILELERLERKYEAHTGYTIINLIEDFNYIFSQTSSGKSYNEQISELIAPLDKAIDTIKRNDNKIPEVPKSALNKALTTMKEKIKPTGKENKDQNRVLIDLSVENRSRLPNVLYKTAVITFYKDNETTLPIEMNYPAASGRGIRIKIDSIVDFGVAAGILYLVLLHISLSYLHPHAFLPYLRNIHHSKTLLPTTAFSLEDTF